MRRIVEGPIEQPAIIREVAHAGAGALLTFAGTVRDNHLGKQVVAIDYHAYEPMAAREIEKIEIDVAARWPGVRILIVHRTGHLALGEVSVFLAVAAAHREEGFDALRHAIDTLKAHVPIWKKEIYVDGEAWIEGS